MHSSREREEWEKRSDDSIVVARRGKEAWKSEKKKSSHVIIALAFFWARVGLCEIKNKIVSYVLACSSQSQIDIMCMDAWVNHDKEPED